MYSLKKTLQKGGVPIVIVVLVNILLQVAAQQGITIDATTVWSIVGAGYGAIIALINWLKNRNQPIPTVLPQK
jgi:predicted tellurium resistance membrane protein TerC